MSLCPFIARILLAKHLMNSPSATRCGKEVRKPCFGHDTFCTVFGPLLEMSTVFPQRLSAQQRFVSNVSSSLRLTSISR